MRTSLALILLILTLLTVTSALSHSPFPVHGSLARKAGVLRLSGRKGGGPSRLDSAGQEETGARRKGKGQGQNKAKVQAKEKKKGEIKVASGSAGRNFFSSTTAPAAAAKLTGDTTTTLTIFATATREKAAAASTASKGRGKAKGKGSASTTSALADAPPSSSAAVAPASPNSVGVGAVVKSGGKTKVAATAVSALEASLAALESQAVNKATGSSVTAAPEVLSTSPALASAPSNAPPTSATKATDSASSSAKAAADNLPSSASSSSSSSAAAGGNPVGAAIAGLAPQSNAALTNTTPGRQLSVLPIGLAVFGGIALITIVVVAIVTYERKKYRRQFRERKKIQLVGQAQPFAGMQVDGTGEVGGGGGGGGLGLNGGVDMSGRMREARI